MTERRKRKLRRKRITNVEEMGFEQGKLYSFQGRFRYLYKEQKPEWQKVHTKIRKDDYLIFLKADLWKSTATKRKLVSVANVKKTTEKLEADGYNIVSVTSHGWRRNKKQINYKSKDPIYSGMIYVGYEDKFGWLNIVKLSKKALQKQFVKVDLSND